MPLSRSSSLVVSDLAAGRNLSIQQRRPASTQLRLMRLRDLCASQNLSCMKALFLRSRIRSTVRPSRCQGALLLPHGLHVRDRWRKALLNRVAWYQIRLEGCNLRRRRSSFIGCR